MNEEFEKGRAYTAGLLDAIDNGYRPMPEPRKIIQIIHLAEKDNLPTFYALCNDGTIWFHDYSEFRIGKSRWVRTTFPEIPQPGDEK